MQRWLSISLLVVLSALATAINGCGSKGVPEGTVVSIVYSSDVRGKLEGCGCKNAGGGIARRSAQVAKAREEDATVLYCDAGNFMTGTAQSDSSKGAVSIAAYNQLKANVVNVSERELAFGLDAFKQARKDAQFKFVSANLRVKGDAVAEPYVVEQVKEARVAFVGVCGTKEAMRTDSARLPEGTTVLDPLAAAREAVVGLKGKADLVVLLSTCGDAMDSVIAHQVPGINLIIGGRSFRPNPAQPWLVDSTRIVRTPRDGRVMGRMDMAFGQCNAIKTYKATAVSMETGSPSDAVMIETIRKFVPNFVDNPTDDRTTQAVSEPSH